MPTVAVFGSSQTRPGSPAWAVAESVGRLLAAGGIDVATGGYGGTMEAVSQGAAAAGGSVIGVTCDALFPYRSGANLHVTIRDDQPSLAARLGRLIEATDGAIVLPGSLGTVTELLVAWNRRYVASYLDNRGWPLIAVEDPWGGIVSHLATVLGAPADLVEVAATGREAAQRMVEKMA